MSSIKMYLVIIRVFNCITTCMKYILIDSDSIIANSLDSNYNDWHDC